MRGGPKVWVGVKWLGIPRYTLTKRNGNQPPSKVSKIRKPYTNGICIFKVGDQPCVFRHGSEDEIWSIVTRITPVFIYDTYYSHTLSYRNVWLGYSLFILFGSRNHCPSRSGHLSFPIRKFRILRSTKEGGPESGKPNLQRAHTCFKVSAGNWDLRSVVIHWKKKKGPSTKQIDQIHPNSEIKSTWTTATKTENFSMPTP